MKDIPPSLREAIEAVGQDRTHGAAWLAREAANVMAQAFSREPRSGSTGDGFLPTRGGAGPRRR